MAEFMYRELICIKSGKSKEPFYGILDGIVRNPVTKLRNKQRILCFRMDLNAITNIKPIVYSLKTRRIKVNSPFFVSLSDNP